MRNRALLCLAALLMTVAVPAQQGTIYSNPFPVPPSWAKNYMHLETANGTPNTWTPCVGSCSGSGGTTGSNSFLLGQTSPLGYPASAQNCTGTSWNCLYYLSLPCIAAGCVQVTNILSDTIYEFSTPNGLQQQEFDPDLYDGNYKYFGSVACELVTSGTNRPANYWGVWNSAANAWVSIGAPCSITAGRHELVIWITTNTATHQLTFQAFSWDGVVQNVRMTFNALAVTGTPKVGIEQQEDGTSATSPVPNNTTYLDQINIWYW